LYNGVVDEKTTPLNLADHIIRWAVTAITGIVVIGAAYYTATARISAIENKVGQMDVEGTTYDRTQIGTIKEALDAQRLLLQEAIDDLKYIKSHGKY
jgi:hypothetical protein